jgi:O-antigen ligase
MKHTAACFRKRLGTGRNNPLGIITVLWLFVWAGMFTDINYLSSPRIFSDFFVFFQAGRALLPLLVIFICAVLLMSVRARFVIGQASLSYLMLYCFIGLMASAIASPNTTASLYWGGLYLSPLLASWLAISIENPLFQIERIIMVNFFACLFIFLMTLPQTLQVARGQAPYTQFYDLPFGFGQMRVNGVGRFALIMAIYAFVQFMYSRRATKYLWGFLSFLALLTLAYTRSRTSLLGLAVVGLLFIYLQGLNIRFFFVSPVVAYILWISGYKWRAQQNFEKLLNLTGREYTWERGIEQIKKSPLFGWGFNADRLMLDSEHMHNSYLHSTIQAGMLGGILFVLAIISIWVIVIKSKILKRVRLVAGEQKKYLMISLMILGFLTSRSLFESTAAFYGVDLFMLLPAICYIYIWSREHRLASVSSQSIAVDAKT